MRFVKQRRLDLFSSERGKCGGEPYASPSVLNQQYFSPPKSVQDAKMRFIHTPYFAVIIFMLAMSSSPKNFSCILPSSI